VRGLVVASPANPTSTMLLPGWRIGWMLVPERLRRAVDVLTGLGITRLAPGIDFDTEEGHRFVRFSFAGRAPTSSSPSTGCPQRCEPEVSRPRRRARFLAHDG
jgi:hypothetical protein